MFSSLRTYCSDISYSQKLYYDNYDYYNTLENCQKTYEHDLSKFVYHCSRISHPTIVIYGDSSFGIPHQRYIRAVSGRPINSDGSTSTQITMQQHINRFINVYIQNNCSGDCQQSQCQLIKLGQTNNLRYQNRIDMMIMSPQELIGILQYLQTANQLTISHLNHEHETQYHKPTILKLQCQLSFELYAAHVIKNEYSNPHSTDFMLLYEFIVEIHRVMWDVLNAKTRTILFLAEPKIRSLPYLVHPLILAITTFLKYDHAQLTNEFDKLYLSMPTSKPRIVLLNLDGKQSYHNIRNIGCLASELLYISIFREPSCIDKLQTMTSSQSGLEVNYARLCEIYSELVVREFAKVCRTQPNIKIKLFPLNSVYLKKSFSQLCRSKSMKIQGLPSLSTSSDIFFLFEHYIFQQLRSYKPTMILISYNGELTLSQPHFSDIIRNCSILADHRVILFPNLISYFEYQQSLGGLDQHQKIACANQFYEKYFQVNVGAINQQVLYGNLSLFLKYGPGLFNMSDRSCRMLADKYHMAHRYRYITNLSQIEEFPLTLGQSQWLSNFTLAMWEVQQLELLFEQCGQWQYRQNSKSGEYYEKMLNTIIAEFVCQNITQQHLEQLLQTQTLNALKLLIQSLVKQREIMLGYSDQDYISEQRAIDARALLSAYLDDMKNRLMFQNVQQSQRTKKYYYYSTKMKNVRDIECLKFALRDESSPDSSEELYLEKYTQVLVNQETQTVFVINCRSADRHLLLWGHLKGKGQGRLILVDQVSETDQELSEQVVQYFEHHYLTEQGIGNQKQDVVYIHYNHCFCGEILYLYWPLMWNLKQEARCRLLGMEYCPGRVAKMLRVAAVGTTYKYENLMYEPAGGVEVLLKWGCTSYATGPHQFIILGGIHESELDYTTLHPNICKVQVFMKQKVKFFSVISRQNSSQPFLKPKINYTVEACVDTSINHKAAQFTKLKVYGGYGRYNTNFFNIFSYDQYEISLDECIPRRIDKYPSKLPTNPYPMTTNYSLLRDMRSLVKLERPLIISSAGKYTVLINNQSIEHTQQKYSDCPKQKFLFDNRVYLRTHDARIEANLSRNDEQRIISFIDEMNDDSELVNECKTMYLFGFMHTIREKMYSKCWSPEIYMIDGIKQSVINLLLRVEKSPGYITANYLMPREEDIISLWIQDNGIYVLARSPAIHENKDINFGVYEGQLGSGGDILRKREIRMNIRYKFSGKQYVDKNLDEKSMLLIGERIHVVGGMGEQFRGMNELSFERHDYIIERVRNRRDRLKVRKLKLVGLENLDMPKSIVIKHQHAYYLYSIVLQEEGDGEGDDIWKLKIEKHAHDNTGDSVLKTGLFKVYFFNANDKQLQKYPKGLLEQPKFVSITPYSRFNLNILRELIGKIIWRTIKCGFETSVEQMRECLVTVQQLHLQTDNQFTTTLLTDNRNTFETMMKLIKNKAEEHNCLSFDEEELLKDVKLAYCLSSKLRIESHLYPQNLPHSEQEYRFIVEDKPSRKVKYMAIGTLNSVQLNFFRIRFRQQLSLCLNERVEQCFFYHPTLIGCQKFEYEKLKSQDPSEYPNWESTQQIKSVILQ